GTCGSAGDALTAVRSKARAGLCRPRSLTRRDQPCHDVEEDHHRPGQQRQRDKAQAYDGGIDPGVIGKPGGDAHHLGVAAVDQETSVHFYCPWIRIHAIGSEVADKTSRSAETMAPARMVAVSRGEVKEA